MYRDFQHLMDLATDVITLGLDTEGCLKLQKLLAVVRAGILEAVSLLAEAKRDLNNSNESFKSLSSPEIDTLSLHSSVRSETSLDSSGVYFAATPKNVSKRRKNKNFSRTQTSFEDSLKDLEPSEIDLFKNANNNGEVSSKTIDTITEHLDREDANVSTCNEHDQDDSKDEEPVQVVVSDPFCWREVEDRQSLDQEILLEKTACEEEDGTPVINVEESEPAPVSSNVSCQEHSEGQETDDRGLPEKSHGDDNVDEVDQAIVMRTFTTPVLAGADPSTCDSTVQPLNLSRKLSVLDTEKFLAEPISPIVNIDREEDGDNDSSRAALPAAVNSTFDTTGDAAASRLVPQKVPSEDS